MKANQLATLVLRLLGIYTLLEFIPAISISISAIPIVTDSKTNWNSPEIAAILVPSLIFTVQFILGILLIVKSVPWGEKIAPNFAELNIPVSFEQFQVLVFAAFGVLIFASALPQLINSFYLFFNSLYELNHKNPYVDASRPYNWRTLFTSVGTFLKAALGLWMFFGAHGFANFWRSLKNFGTPKPPEN